ncbi:MAG TPA: hypothetical protein VI912_00780 [Candidatus Bilamarchaeaceae archaeon]|nr:hypothetical protein [Candidatus Bilamarchaeaceae archaeon]
MADILASIQNPEEALSQAKKATGIGGPITVFIISGLFFLIALLVFGKFKDFVGPIIGALAITIFSMVYAFFAKIPFEMLSGNRGNSVYNSFVASSLGSVQISLGLLLFSIIGFVGSFFTPSVPLLSVVFVLIGALVLVYYALVGISIATKAYKELFKTDYVVVLVANGIVSTSLTILIVMMYMLIFQALVGTMMMGGFGRSL